MSTNVYFASESLSSRITEDDLERQSKTSIETDHTLSTSGAIESTVYFENDRSIFTVFQCEIHEELKSISFLTGVSVGDMLEKFSSKLPITRLTLNNEFGDEIITFDVAKKAYNVVITKCKDDLNSTLKLIFI